jgi:hypothetical protein
VTSGHTGIFRFLSSLSDRRRQTDREREIDSADCLIFLWADFLRDLKKKFNKRNYLSNSFYGRPGPKTSQVESDDYCKKSIRNGTVIRLFKFFLGRTVSILVINDEFDQVLFHFSAKISRTFKKMDPGAKRLFRISDPCDTDSTDSLLSFNSLYKINMLQLGRTATLL